MTFLVFQRSIWIFVLFDNKKNYRTPLMASFSDQLVSILNANAVGTALGVASRTGLLSALDQSPLSASILAKKASIHPRHQYPQPDSTVFPHRSLLGMSKKFSRFLSQEILLLYTILTVRPKLQSMIGVRPHSLLLPPTRCGRIFH